MSEQYVGEVEHWFGNIDVAGIRVTDGEIKIGDTIHVSGHTSDFTHEVDSMEIDNEPVEKAGPGDLIGVRVPEHARPGDSVYVVQ